MHQMQTGFDRENRKEMWTIINDSFSFTDLVYICAQSSQVDTRTAQS